VWAFPARITIDTDFDHAGGPEGLIEEKTMAEFWENLFACEDDGFTFIHDNGWELTEYDVKIIIHPETHSLNATPA
jgi:hypothetical protein